MPIIEEKSRLQKLMDAPAASEGLEMHYRSRLGKDWTRQDNARINHFNRDPDQPKKLARHQKSYGNKMSIQLPMRSHRTGTGAKPITFKTKR